MWSDWKSCGLLPEEGPIGAQRAWVVEAIQGLQSEMDAIQAQAARPKAAVKPGTSANAMPPTNKAPPKITGAKLPPKSERRKRPDG